LLDYAALPETPSNRMVRWLTGKNSDPNLNEDDLEFAKALLERKFLVMLTDKMATSIERLIYYMNWDESATIPELYKETKSCLITNTNNKEEAQNQVPKVGTVEYDALYAINELDMKLYEHAKKVFKKQTALFTNKRKKSVVELFLGSATKEQQDDDLVQATKRSDYEASQARALLMERPPEEHRSIEATNSLMASALMLHHRQSSSSDNTDKNSTSSFVKNENNMIASTLARKLHGGNKWG